VFQICEDYGWQYIIVLKDDDLPSVTREFKALCTITPHTKHIVEKDTVKYSYRWINNIVHAIPNI
jgi:hypothetical protein